jgi:hypothetical protein
MRSGPWGRGDRAAAGRTPGLAAALPALLLALAATPARAGFEIGYYDHVSTPRVRELAEAGVTLIVAYAEATSDPQQLLDEAARRGVRVALQVEPRLDPKADAHPAVERFVGRWRGHPALWGWYAFDEPELSHTRVRAAAIVRLLKRLDPRHPVLSVHSNDPKAAAFADLADVVGLDYYPVTHHALATSRLEVVNPLAERLVGWTRPARRQSLFVVQAFSWGDLKKDCPRCRFPTPHELRYLTYAPIVAGVDGVVYWTRYRTPDVEWRRTVAPLLREVAALRGSLDRTAAGRTERCAPGVRARALPDGLVIAVNDTPRAVVSVRVLGPREAAHAEVVGERRGLPVVRGQVVDSFEPYAVHVYRFGPRPRPSAPP